MRALLAAAIQMNVAPAPVPERLARAEGLVVSVAGAGAQLVVLPELFNSGYAYSDANYRLAEPPDGPTLSWMRHIAARLDVHLAGSLLLLDRGEIHNAMCLVAPDGRSWRYDKNYPWCWESNYFQRGRRITVAETDLGALGMMICWDVAHPRLWRRYAGRVDAMVISSSPPDFGNAACRFPNGDRVAMDGLGAHVAPIRAMGQRVFGRYLRQQAAWLGVPVVSAAACGSFESCLPNGLATLLGCRSWGRGWPGTWRRHGRWTCRARWCGRASVGCTALTSSNSSSSSEGTVTTEWLTLADSRKQARTSSAE